MQCRQLIWSQWTGWSPGAPQDASLVLYFVARPALASGERYDELRRMCPAAPRRWPRRRDHTSRRRGGDTGIAWKGAWIRCSHGN